MKRLIVAAALCALAACSQSSAVSQAGAADRAFQEPGFAAYCADHTGVGFCP